MNMNILRHDLLKTQTGANRRRSRAHRLNQCSFSSVAGCVIKSVG